MAGYTITKSDYEKQLREQSKSLTGGKTWAELYQSNYLAGERAKALAEESYLDAAAQAYQSSLSRRSDILGSNLGQGYKQQALTDTDLALQEAYNTYMNSYAEKANEIASSVEANANKFDEAVASEAEWMEKTGQSIEDYFKYLYNTYYTVDEETGIGVLNKDYEKVNPFVQNEEIWGRYLKHPVTEEGEDITSYMLKSPEELSTMLYDIDEQGNRVLNTLGQDFYDMVMNYMPTPVYDEEGNLVRTDIEQAKSYGDYLQEKNKDLYDYLSSSDLYNINTAGTKFGTFKELIGLGANDYEYSWLERAGGMNKEEVDNLFGNIDKAITDLGKGDQGDQIVKIGDQLNILMSKLGFGTIDFNEIKNELYKNIRNKRSFDDTFWEYYVENKNAIEGGANAEPILSQVWSTILSPFNLIASAIQTSFEPDYKTSNKQRDAEIAQASKAFKLKLSNAVKEAITLAQSRVKE